MQENKRANAKADCLLTKQDIAARYAISLRQVGTLQQRRILPYLKIGRLVRFQAEACDRALKAFEVRSVVDVAG